MGKHHSRFVWLIVLAITSAPGIHAAHGQKAKQRGVQDASSPASSSVAPGANYALVIGNNNYKDLGKLKTAVDDAKAVAELLHEQYGFATTVLLDATRNNILTALNTYRRTLTPNSHLLIYYAGHGYHDREVDKAYWLPVDAQKDNNENWISADDISSDVKAIPSNHVLIISDSCYSGDLTRDAGIEFTPEDREIYLAKSEARKSRNLMSSGGDEPVTDSGAPGHSIFAWAILDGLQHNKQDKFTAEDLFHRVKQRVGGRSDQLPQYNPIRNSGHEEGDFVFARKPGSPGANTAAAPDANAPPAVPGKQPKSNDGGSIPLNTVVQKQPGNLGHLASAAVSASGAALDLPHAQPTPQLKVPDVAVQRFMVVHYGIDTTQFCIGWMTIQPGMIQYRALQGNDGTHSIDIPLAAIKEIKKNGLFGVNYQAFHIRLTGNANYNFSVVDTSNVNNPRFLNADALLVAVNAAAGK